MVFMFPELVVGHKACVLREMERGDGSRSILTTEIQCAPMSVGQTNYMPVVALIQEASRQGYQHRSRLFPLLHLGHAPPK